MCSVRDVCQDKIRLNVLADRDWLAYAKANAIGEHGLGLIRLERLPPSEDCSSVHEYDIEEPSIQNPHH